MSPKHKHHNHDEEKKAGSGSGGDLWSVAGQFEQLCFSPKGEVEGLLMLTDGVRTQFVCDPHDRAVAGRLGTLHQGQKLEVEGWESEPSDKGEAEHTVYRLERVASVDGHLVKPEDESVELTGKVVSFHYARHGERNGLMLDSGDFVHIKPKGLVNVAVEPGKTVRVTGKARPLTTGRGRVIDAESIDGRPLRRP